MAKKDKPVYTVTAFDDIAPRAVYSTLKTLCEQWGLLEHYSTVYKSVRRCGTYEDSKVLIKKHILIKSGYGVKP